MKYTEIINLKRPKSNYPKSDNLKRASQFAAFKALDGYDEEIYEVGRYVKKKKELTEMDKKILDLKMHNIEINKKNKPIVTITYFIPDLKKDGGSYKIISSYIKHIDKVGETIKLDNNMTINFSDILNIESDEIDLLLEF